MNIPFNYLGASEKRSLYARFNRRCFNMEAVFSDETKNFVYPISPAPGGTVTVRLRAAAGDAGVSFVHVCGSRGDKKYPMAPSHKPDGIFEYHSATIAADEEPLLYYFSIHKNGKIYYYNKKGLGDKPHPDYNFKIVPGITAPDWARGAVMYQIFVDRFNNGDPSNDVVNYEYMYLGKPARAYQWDKDVAANDDDIRHFCGGDLKGVMDKMPYLKSLGVEALYLNPVFVSPSNHKYDIQDYGHVDPHYGAIVVDEGEALTFEKPHNKNATKYICRTTDIRNLDASDAVLADMIALAHEYGMRVILDGVFNHCGCFNKWLDKAGFYETAGVPGAYRDEKSPYVDYFVWNKRSWPDNNDYEGWWGNENHPKLNFEDSPELYEYILGIAKKWVSPPYSADGWRLDVAADLGQSPSFNHKFWKDFRLAVKSANPEAIVIAEHYGDATEWLDGGEWDTVMNYDAFMMPLTWFLTGMSKHSDSSRPDLYCDAQAFENAMRYHMAKMNVHALQTAMNELSNHDHSRFLTRTNRHVGRLGTHGPRAAEKGVDKNIMLEAVFFQMTWPGAPTMYYGDEAGLAGWTDPDNRRTFPWGGEDELLLEAHRTLAKLRNECGALRTGSLEYLHNDYGFISYGRWDEQSKVIVAINNGLTAKDVMLPVWKAGCTSGKIIRAAAAFDGRFICDDRPYVVRDGTLRLTVPGKGAFV
ncbi:MAG: glycoside hydrolase family 13 protein, partial [Defluviitaleaceae bacterium]|nr:glycoside hydrolase family 13 protein [Defluviitaleaceae bacterium]